LSVNRSTYYKHFSKEISDRTLQNQKIRSSILSIYSASKKRLGAYKICYLLGVEYGINISVGRVYRLMKSMNLPKMSTVKPKFIHSKSDNPATFKNKVNQNFSTDKPNLVWVSDITYVKVNGSFNYICVIIDLYSRKVISYSVSNKMDVNLVADTFNKAFAARNHPDNLIFHSDRGSQYTSKIFRKILDRYNVIQSFSAKGYPYDNAVAESFFKFLKLEELNRQTFYTKAQLELSLFEYIESFYNSKRPHSANGMLSPNQKEKLYFDNLNNKHN
jgi:transposase (fragment)